MFALVYILPSGEGVTPFSYYVDQIESSVST